MSNLLNNTTSLQRVLDALRTKAMGNAPPVLYGTYIFTSSPSDIFNYRGEENFDGLGVYTYFYKDGWVYAPISLIFVEQDFEIYNRDKSCCNYISTGEWHNPTLPEFPDDRYRIIDFTTPVLVSQDFYDLFISLVDNTNVTAYDIGYGVGAAEGILDIAPILLQGTALSVDASDYGEGEYMYQPAVFNTVVPSTSTTFNWQDVVAYSATEESETLTVTVINNHPTLDVAVYIYLTGACTLASGERVSRVHYQKLVVAPGEDNSFWYALPEGYDYRWVHGIAGLKFGYNV